MRSLSGENTSLKDVLAQRIPAEIENIKAFRKEHAATKVGEVTVDMVSDPLPAGQRAVWWWCHNLPHPFVAN